MVQLNRRVRRAAAEILLAVVLVLLCGGCAEEKTPMLVAGKDENDPYSHIVLSSMEDYTLKRSGWEFFGDLNGSNLLECFDVQAVPAVRQGVGDYWYPQCLATVVIAVDRAQTDAVIRGWRDLAAAGLPVYWNDTGAQRAMNLAALCYGLEGKQYTKQSGLNMLRELYAAGNLAFKDRSLPVLVCFDYQAVNLNRQGRELEIVVPQEGTFSYALGLLSHQMLNAVPDEALLAGGMRLIDWRSSGDAYPSDEAYAPAARVEDYERFLQQTSNVNSDLRRVVQHSRLFSSTNDREHVTFAVGSIVLALFWMATAVHRSIRRDLQYAVRLLAMLVVGWLSLRLFKYQLDSDSTLNRYCWYGFYIFQMALPTVMLYISAVFDKPESNGRPPRWLLPFMAVYPVFLLLVFTNDLHQLVFRFDLQGDWSAEYSYGPVYLLIYAYCFIEFFLSIGMLIKKSWRSPKRAGWILPLLLGVLILAYATAYALNVPLARDSDLTITICTFAILFFESALRTGLIPSNTRYSILFESSPLDMQLLDTRGKTVLASSSVAPLEPVLCVQLQSQPSVSVSRDADTLLFGHEIHGGTAVWQENIGPLNRLHREIEESVERLKAANALLRKEGEVRRQRVAAEVKAELFASLERETEAKTAELTQAIRELPGAPDRERQTAYITLLLCHIKRRCNLFFLTQEGADMAGDELTMYLDELSEFAGYAGVNALVRCDISGMMDVRVATLCYDFYFAVCAWSVRGSRDTLLGQLQGRGNALNFSILSAEEARTLEFPQPFLQAVESAGGEVTRRIMDETVGLYLTFPKGGAEND